MMREALTVFFSTLVVHVGNTITRPMFQIVLVAQPVVVATTTYMIYRDAGIEQTAAYVLIGGGLAGIWSAMTFSSAGDISRERFYGTLPSMVGSPSPLSLIFGAKICANALLSLLALAISFGYSGLILGVTPAIPNLLAFAVGVTAFLFSASTFALALSAVFMLSRSTGIMQNFLEYPLLLLGGMAFPVAFLPGWTQTISIVLPMRWGSEVVRGTLDAGGLGAAWGDHLLVTAGIGTAYLALALWLFGRIEYRVRAMGNLEIA